MQVVIGLMLTPTLSSKHSVYGRNQACMPAVDTCVLLIYRHRVLDNHAYKCVYFASYSDYIIWPYFNFAWSMVLVLHFTSLFSSLGTISFKEYVMRYFCKGTKCTFVVAIRLWLHFCESLCCRKSNIKNNKVYGNNTIKFSLVSSHWSLKSHNSQHLYQTFALYKMHVMHWLYFATVCSDF